MIMNKLPSPDSDVPSAERQVEKAELALMAADRVLRTAGELIRREYPGPLSLIPSEGSGRHPAPETSSPPDNVVPIAGPSYRPPAQGELVNTDQYHMVKAWRAEIHQIHALASPDLSLEDINQAGQEAA